MTRNIVIIMFMVGVYPMLAFADETRGADADTTKILVTFSDPGMSNAARAGPSGPGYRRRSSTYLTSVGVKRAANRIADDFDLIALDEWPIISLEVHCLVFGVADDAHIEDLLTRLRLRPEVESAQLMNEFEVSGTTVAHSEDPYANLQHNLSTLELGQAHIWSLGDGAKVTIIDTGADLDHPELRTQIASHHDFVENRDGDFSADAHGTAVAGVIGAASNNGVGMIGVAPLSRLSVLKACWHRQGRSRASCNSFTLAKALSHAIESDTDVINLSLGGPSDTLLARLVDEALKRGLIIVAAAPQPGKSGFPTEVSGVIVVGSNNQSSSRNTIDQFSIEAPGEDILVPVPRGGYDYASGSSLSAAHVSGIVALLVARRPNLSNDQISSLLLDSRPSADDSVNACRALAKLLQESGCVNRQAVSRAN